MVHEDVLDTSGRDQGLEREPGLLEIDVCDAEVRVEAVTPRASSLGKRDVGVSPLRGGTPLVLLVLARETVPSAQRYLLRDAYLIPLRGRRFTDLCFLMRISP